MQLSATSHLPQLNFNPQKPSSFSLSLFTISKSLHPTIKFGCVIGGNKNKPLLPPQSKLPNDSSTVRLVFVASISRVVLAVWFFYVLCS
ncbi:hypothetical protein DL95DRAFT_386114, partial [Leptodontidium sp. 2 PMI_412]